ncbi:serine/threonine-protein kinase [Streptomyces sp. XM4193]|uniref:serine/threonine-protein kinase n=1 Tax=Streptomyces sp. XM4193 TaxID=2929782 RepID=UPI001FF87E16|nr:serine/threonine-protein kinase [Streptomyces sp. XM4193]MCK1795184.1 serine/threonine-protein kinase [Streptomyces sp. XM4193]
MEPLRAEDPTRIGDLALRARLGSGGMGQVYLGRTPGGKTVAVKVVYAHLALQPNFRRRFRREVIAARAVSGAYTAPVVAAGVDDNPPWIATSYVPGPSLFEAVSESGPLPENSLWLLAAGLVEALQAIHTEDLLHRDLKPSNILMAEDGPRVIDFGIAHAMDGTALTPTNATIGTPGFMSPEQAEGRHLDAASDIFSLGAVLAYAATGQEPFGHGPPLAILHRVVNGTPRLTGTPEPVLTLVERCLAKDPAMRPTPPQLLGEITTHWTPPDNPTWPKAVNTLIESTPQTPPRTTPYGRPDAVEPTPDGLTARHVHAYDLGESGDRVGAARLLAEIAVDKGRVLGRDHPRTLTTRHNHAYNLGESGDHAQAARLLAEVAADRARVLGPDHPRTLTTRHNHAYNLGESGDRAGAARLLAEIAADKGRVLGRDHPRTLTTRHNHAYNLGESGDHAQAARLLAQVALDKRRVLGPDHPHTLTTRHEHAYSLGASGGRAQAALLLAEVAGDRARVLGPDHPQTRLSRREQLRMQAGSRVDPGS